MLSQFELAFVFVAIVAAAYAIDLASSPAIEDLAI